MTPSDGHPPRWVDGEQPPVPRELSAWIAGPGGAERPDVEALAEAGIDALAQALPQSTPDGDRREACHLLAADALLTWAAEAALAEDDPEAALERLAQRLSRLPDAG